MNYLHIQVQCHGPRTALPLDVLVPGREEGTGPFRLAVLLHDIAGNNTSWIRRYPVEEIFRGTGTVVAMPSCLNSFCVNMYYGYDMLDYTTKDLPELLGKWMNISANPEDHMIAGYGMGGYGAVRAALAAPAVYGKVLSLDGLLDPEVFYDEPIPAVRMEDVFGPREYFLQGADNLKVAAKSCRAALSGGAGLPEIVLQQNAPEAGGAVQKLAEILQAEGFSAELTTGSAVEALRRFAGSAAGCPDTVCGGEKDGTH